jgi:hypothetical protein
MDSPFDINFEQVLHFKLVLAKQYPIKLSDTENVNNDEQEILVESRIMESRSMEL